ncbi:hypothetical protein BVRB_6g147950 [Beta vulgaris subsp. vulgaris]|nr:hypothetical protein BVRB_6g147950 [Beta vulgaris subsp. vulgaris]
MANFGRIRLGKIINRTNHKLRFHNPWKNESGEIDAGLSESNNCNGYLPSWDDGVSRRYEISYYSDVLKQTKTMIIEERDDWLLSIQETGSFRDGCEVNPPYDSTESEFQIVISSSGYEIYCNYCLIGRRFYVYFS